MGESDTVAAKNASEHVERYKSVHGIDNNSEAVRQALERGAREHPHVSQLQGVVRRLVMAIALVTLVAAGAGYSADLFTAARVVRLSFWGLAAIVMIGVAFEAVRLWYARRPPEA